MDGQQAASRLRDRYDLEDLVASTEGSTMWRAYDNRLRRTVGLRIVPGDHPRIRQLHDAAVSAAHITDRSFINVLDVLGPEPDDQLIIISEWFSGMTLDEVLAERMSPYTAVTTVGRIAEAIAAAHSQSVAHGRLRPRSIALGPDGSVRVRGHGVDASLTEISPAGLTPGAADVYGLGSLLYACLTARWPGPEEVGLPTAPRIDGRAVSPSRLVADVPKSLDRIIFKCWSGEYEDASEVAAALRTARDELAEPHRRSFWTGRRRALAAAGAATLLVGGAVLASLAEASSRPGDPLTAAPRVKGLATIAAVVGKDEHPLPVVSARDYDPFGVDGENPKEVRFAKDGDPTTAWTTLDYYDPYLSGKRGVGLLLDLGAPRPVTSISVGLVGANTDLTVLMGNNRRARLSHYKVFAKVNGAGSRILLRAPRPVTGRYVLLWFTRLPWIDGSYRGGVRSVVVRSG